MQIRFLLTFCTLTVAPSESSNAFCIANDIVPVPDRLDCLDIECFEELFDDKKNNLESWKDEHSSILPPLSVPGVLRVSSGNKLKCFVLRGGMPSILLHLCAPYYTHRP